MKNAHVLFVALVVGLGLVACNSTPPPTKTDKSAPAAAPVSAVSTPTPTPAPQSASSSASSVTRPTATATPAQPTPTSTPAALTRKIAYSQCGGLCQVRTDYTIWIVNYDGSGATKIVDLGLSPTFSPEGTRIAFEHSVEGIIVANVNGSNATRIVPGNTVGLPDWSHDGKTIAFVDRSQCPKPPGAPGSPPLPGGPNKPPTGAGIVNLSFGTSRESNLPSSSLTQLCNIFINVVAPDGTGRRMVTVGDHPTWSADDTQIAYDTCVGGTCGIYRINAAGGEPIKVTDDVGSVPHWSRDGKRILYQVDVDGVKQLFVVNVDGSGKKQLTTGKDYNVDGTWSIDGNSILFRSTRGSIWGIWVMNADGTNPRKILDNVPPANWGDEKLSVSK